MEKCLVTKLKGSVDNTEFSKIGEIRIKISKVDNPTESTQQIYLQFTHPETIYLIGDGYFTDSTLTDNKGISQVINRDVYVYVSNMDGYLVIPKYTLSRIGLSKTRSAFELDTIDIFKYSNLNYLYIKLPMTKGDIASLKNNPIFYLNITSKYITGEIQTVKHWPKIDQIQINNTQIKGNLEEIKDCTSITSIRANRTLLTGDLSSCKQLVNCSSLGFSYTEVSGNINDLNNLSKLMLLQISLKNVTGDLATLPASFFYFEGVENSTSVLKWSNRPASYNVISIVDKVAIDNIDKMFQDQAKCVVPSNTTIKTISVKGTRTSASDEAVAELQSKGYTISVVSNS